MDSVRLAERYVSSSPGQLSGGLKQRLAIARSFAGNPKLVVCDEPTSALDVSVQAAILNLLVELQAQQQVSYLFISHDLGVVRYVSDRIAVLYLGRLMELGLSETVYDGPHHPYTEALLSAVPNVDGGERTADQARRGHSECGEPADRLRLPYALPAQDRDDLRRDRAATRRGRGEPPDAVPHPARRVAHAAGSRATGGVGRRHSVKIRAAVLEATGGPFGLQDLDLAPPGPGEALVRLGASGVCHSDFNAIDGTSETRCPAVLGHEGAGVVEAVGPDTTRVAGRRSCRALVVAVVRCVCGMRCATSPSLLDGMAARWGRAV